MSCPTVSPGIGAPPQPMPKITTLEGFGPRLAALRQSRGMTQVELGRAADELLDLTPLRETVAPRTARLLTRLRRIEELPRADQRAILRLVDAMLETRRRSTPAGRKRQAS